MADYPSTIWTPPTTPVTGEKLKIAEHWTSPTEEISAIETELGTSPSGASATVAARLAAIEAASASSAVIRDNNYIINGAMAISQEHGEGASAVSTTNGDYMTDMFRANMSTSAATDFNHTLDSPDDYSQYCIDIDVTTADASPGATDYYQFSTWVEGYNYQALHGGVEVTLSFYVKSPKTGTHTVHMHDSGPDRNYVTSYTVSAADTWEKKTITITTDTAAGSWVFDEQIGLQITWMLMAGSSLTASTEDAWYAGSSSTIAASGQVNCLDSASNNFKITQVKLEVGASATQFRMRDISTEIDMAQRFLEKTYNIGTAVATTTTNGVEEMIAPAGQIIESRDFTTRKRTSPTMVYYSSATGSTGVWRNFSTAADVSVTTLNISEHTFAFNPNPGVSDGNIVGGHWSADARY